MEKTIFMILTFQLFLIFPDFSPTRRETLGDVCDASGGAPQFTGKYARLDTSLSRWQVPTRHLYTTNGSRVDQVRVVSVSCLQR